MINKDSYILQKVRDYIEICAEENEGITPLSVASIIDMFSADYDLCEQYHQEEMKSKLEHMKNRKEHRYSFRKYLSEKYYS
ncbi:hypothetical protein [Oceanobacillus kimchii]|uniref:Uncharacterized protein n=1 Tax=Oceanobacillus kimchii TaxID=746691 RepID=A0ABQ5TJJ6_9BACI|nr:hypothetical protein [Oceanobacillus kimchii]GLO66277.1 hypothetical protein MACH08_20610 [Oceanobacillus kimchii]